VARLRGVLGDRDRCARRACVRRLACEALAVARPRGVPGDRRRSNGKRRASAAANRGRSADAGRRRPNRTSLCRRRPNRTSPCRRRLNTKAPYARGAPKAFRTSGRTLGGRLRHNPAQDPLRALQPPRAQETPLAQASRRLLQTSRCDVAMRFLPRARAREAQRVRGSDHAAPAPSPPSPRETRDSPCASPYRRRLNARGERRSWARKSSRARSALIAHSAFCICHSALEAFCTRHSALASPRAAR
jgi:hypothetical protein